MLADFFAPLAIKIFAGVTLALALALGIALWRADSISADRDREQERRVSAELRLSASNASVERLSAEMEALVSAGVMRAERLDNALSQVAEENRTLLEQADKLERGEIDVSQVEGL